MYTEHHTKGWIHGNVKKFDHCIAKVMKYKILCQTNTVLSNRVVYIYIYMYLFISPS